MLQHAIAPVLRALLVGLALVASLLVLSSCSKQQNLGDIVTGTVSATFFPTRNITLVNDTARWANVIQIGPGSYQKQLGTMKPSTVATHSFELGVTTRGDREVTFQVILMQDGEAIPGCIDGKTVDLHRARRDNSKNYILEFSRMFSRRCEGT